MANSRFRSSSRPAALAATIVAAASLWTSATRAEPAACLSPDPSQWPAPSRPYFMLAVDTSGSLTTPVANANSCGYAPNDRIAHARCAVKKTAQAFGGEVNFGLSTFAVIQSSCGASCYGGCQYFCFNEEINTTGNCFGCGPRPGGAATRAGAFIRVPMLQDHFWVGPPAPDNTAQIVSWADNDCTNSVELFALGSTPLNGMLRDMARYFSATGWTAPDGSVSYPTPLDANDRAGTGVNGGTACRSVNVILITDGDETCDTQQDAVNAAAALYQTGVTVGGKTFKIPVNVINFAGGSQANTDAIAAAGGTGASYFATNEVQLSQALANIVAGSIKPETCDNTDNNCNGCTDEGFTHYANVQPVPANCCPWGTAAQRTTCLNNYKSSITPANPKGNLTLLPCTTIAQQAAPATWLCVDPGDTCDNVDNNGVNGVDEGTTKCGSPLHCPQPETCNGQDDDCDGVIDNGGVCAACKPSAEICDGCDNNCDGKIDENIAPIPCGQASPPNCAGFLTCKTIAGSYPPGTCVAGGGFNACSNNPQAEVCDGLDNDCNGIVDDGVPSIPCIPPSHPAGLVYGGNSQCQKGTTACVNGATVCQGGVGPSAEVCDGIDNNCNGIVDDGVSGTGQPCGINTPPCKAGTTACVSGALVCQGAIGPQPEICDGIDNNCNGQIDEAPLANGPPAGMTGCWNLPGNACTFANLSWSPPAGATCNGNGTLTSPCNAGVLTCNGAAGWSCQGGKTPSAEVCDGLDNNCNGMVDDGVPLVGTTCGSNVGACKAGVYQCSGGVLSCVGSIGPTAEVCDGLDNDCNGKIDDNVPGTGVACGNSTPPCSPGSVACVAGALVCQGGVQPQPEICDGIDNNCDGQIDNGVLADAPPAGQGGCWDLPGNCCTFKNLSWCGPPGSTCSGKGSLTSPCSAGTLTCTAGAWTCQGPKDPSAEVCDGIDNNCDGQVDNVAPVPCVPAGTPAGLVYGGNSQCKMGTKTCGACVGFVGPSAEICDGIDNNCDGQVDNGVAGLAKPCGINQGPCKPGATACVNGAIVCSGGIGPTPEICDGIDNDCDGQVDNGALADAPAPGQNGCWNDPGNCCSFKNLSWCPPTGATCTGVGTLTSPCIQGSLVCAGGGGWICQNPKVPAPESCDGVDNDCNGAIDDGPLPMVGTVCGSNVGECKTGLIACNSGVLSCAGDVGPKPEICDGLDNDCNGVVDNGIPVGGPCTVAYDTTLFPGDRTALPCQPGILQCNGMGGQECVGGVGPSAEVCDGIDNDCDGTVDEVGATPDGIDGSADPQSSGAKIGDACGVNVGECKAGAFACLDGKFACLGGQAPQPEQCDCLDNDCNGATDNQNPNGPPLCGAGKQCVKSNNSCACAAPCSLGEFPCPPGQICQQVNSSETGMPLGGFCVVDTSAACGDCTTKTVKDSNDKVVCAPAGTMLANCVQPPVCVCKGQNGCEDPCLGVTCPAGQVCAELGPNAGKCTADNCWNNPCQGCDKLCNLGACTTNPCTPTSCPADKECKPKADLSGFDCVLPCSSVTCPPDNACVDGACVPACKPACPSGQVCDTSSATCVANKCMPNPCTDGSCCDPITGACGNCPCAGVICPAGASCDPATGQCGQVQIGTGGGGAGGGSTTTSMGTTSTHTGTGGGGGSGSTKDHGIWGLATGGGGCSCEVGPGARDLVDGRLALLVLMGIAARRRRTQRRQANGEAAS